MQVKKGHFCNCLFVYLLLSTNSNLFEKYRLHTFCFLGTDRTLDQIDWTELEKEFEWETLKSFWQEREVKAILMDFAVALFLLAASGFDVGMDIKLAHQYIG